MPDQIIFNDNLGLTSGLGNALLSGAVAIDYGAPGATPIVTSQNLQIAAFGGLGAQTYSSLAVTQTGVDGAGVPIYLLTGTNGITNLSITYTGVLPATANATVTNAATLAPLATGAAPVVAAVVCFAAGTRLRTSRGDVAVETLKKGDELVTAFGACRKIVWSGSRTIDCRRHPEPRAVQPIRIAKDAFADGKPARDLVVSPGHGICVAVLDEVLIPASLLVNGTTVTQLDVESVVYWHVELESHDIVLAEGLPTESYIDVGNRAFFAQGQGVPDGRPDAATLEDYCRPYVTDEGLTRAVRARLQARAKKLGWRLDEAPEADIALVADGRTILPDMDGLKASFQLPATVSEAWLVSATSVPANIRDTWDARRLGVCVRALAIGTGATLREIGIEDPKLCVGFHPPEGAPGSKFRWTTGRALLPAGAWRGMAGTIRLEIRLAAPALPRWVAPTETVAATPSRPSLVAAA